jgi:hypothetical protein
VTEAHPTRSSTSRLRAAGPALLSAALALVLYAVTLGGTFVYDDLFIAHDDERLRDVSRWAVYWTSDYFGGALDRLWRPLVSTSFAVQAKLHGDTPWAFHAVNWVLHAGVCALVAELARRLCGRRAAYAAGLLFAAHPVHVEAVAAIVGRSELACAAGTVGALVLLARRPLTGGRVFGIWACLVVALLSKEQGMLLPLLMWLQWIAMQWTLRPVDAAASDAPGRRQAGKWLLALVLATLAGYVVYREQTIRFWWDRSQLDWVMNPLVRSRGADKWLMPLALLGRYTALLVAPWRLSPDYGATVIGWQAHAADPYLWVGAAALVLWATLLAAAVRRRAWAAAFCVLAVGITYGMVANALTLIGTIFNERLMYLPSVFFLVLVGIGAAAAWGRRPRVTVAVLVLLVLLGSLRTFTYARRWNDRRGFYEASLREQPRSVQLYLLLATEYRERGDAEAAERVMAAARREAPDYWPVYNHSALAALARGDLDAAEAYVGRAMSMHPGLEGVAIMEQISKARAATRPAAAGPAR